MTCYSPLIRAENTTIWETAQDGHKYHPAKIFKADDKTGEYIEKLTDGQKYKYTIIPCRNCIGCKLDYSREWANRGYLHSKTTHNNYFITLTYNDENIKIKDYIVDKDGMTWENENLKIGCLIPKDIEIFIHNLRQHQERKYGINGLQYMLCGEYGEKNGRPHYHAILFNCYLPTDTFYKPKIINNEIYYQNTIIEKYWKHGISNISTASWHTIAYTARYITKKINGKQSEELYSRNGLIKEFFRTSKGIGRKYYEQNKLEIYKHDKITIKTKQGTINCQPPKYFDKLFEKEYPKEFKQIKKRRKENTKQLNNVNDLKDELSRLERLKIKQSYKMDSLKALTRRIE